MQAEEVIKLYKLFQENKIKAWIDGGWGIDALLGEQTRPHDDLDIAIQHKDVSKLRSLLNGFGYKDKERKDASDSNFVLGDDRGHEVDVHTFEFDDKGNNVYGIAYPAESLTGIGTIAGKKVKCISLKWVLNFHSYFEPKEKDFKDMKALCDKFGVELPENYKNH